MPFQTSSKCLNRWASNRLIPAFGLDIDHVESEAIFIDDAVDTAIPTSANGLTGIDARTAVAHRNEEIDDELLKKAR